MTFKPKLGGGLSSLLAEEEKKKNEALVQQKSNNSLEENKPFEYTAPSAATERIRIIFDDSGSMAGPKIIDAQDGCIEFMKNCVVNKTAVAIHPMCYRSTDLTALTTNLPALSILVKDIRATGGTPMFETLQAAMKQEPKATRYIIFSDGMPDYNEKLQKETIDKLISTETKCDTVLIADYGVTEDHPAYTLMKEIADKTGGIFLVFDRTKVNFKSAFKYLAPTLRLQLAASVDMQKALQEGKLG